MLLVSVFTILCQLIQFYYILFSYLSILLIFPIKMSPFEDSVLADLEEWVKLGHDSFILSSNVAFVGSMTDCLFSYAVQESTNLFGVVAAYRLEVIRNWSKSLPPPLALTMAISSWKIQEALSKLP